MAGQTAAEKLAARGAAVKPPNGVDTAPPAKAVAKGAPVTADYDLFGLVSLGDPAEFAWVNLGGKVKAATYTAAMDLAKDALRKRLVAQATEEAPVPATLRLTVAAIASRNWNQGTAIVEMQPVTTWEKS